MLYRLKHLTFLSVIFFFSCEKEETVFMYSVEPELESFVNAFYAEADLRGVVLPKTNLIVEFGEVSEELCGQCERPKGSKELQRKVLISKASSCWGNSVNQNKEALVFHELGHCLLNREHKEVFFAGGAPKSIMVKVLEGPYQPCVYVFNENPMACNRTIRRKYYLDELFNENIAEVPSWANQE